MAMSATAPVLALPGSENGLTPAMPMPHFTPPPAGAAQWLSRSCAPLSNPGTTVNDAGAPAGGALCRHRTAPSAARRHAETSVTNACVAAGGAGGAATRTGAATRSGDPPAGANRDEIAPHATTDPSASTADAVFSTTAAL